MELEPARVQNHFVDESNRYSVVIGPNGVGKSRILKEVAQSFVDSREKGIWPASTTAKGSYYQQLYPTKVLAVSNMVFDKFPMTQWDADEYVYLGARQGSNMLTTSTWSSYVHESCAILILSGHFDRLKPTMELLDLELVSLPKIYRSSGSRKRFDFLRNHLVHGNKAEEGARLLRSESTMLNQLSSMGARKIESLVRVLARISDLPFTDKARSKERGRWESHFSHTLLNLFDEQDVWALRFCSHHNLIRFESEFRRPDYALAVEDLSAGEQLLLSLMGRIVSNITENSLVLVDEPDVGLHPEWQAQLIPLIRESIPINFGCHFIMATHSPLVVADGSDVLVPGGSRGRFIPFRGSTEGRSIETILYEAFQARSPRSQMVEKDLDYLIQTMSKSPGRVDQRKVASAVSRLSAIAGDDTPAVNLILDQMRSFDLPGED